MLDPSSVQLHARAYAKRIGATGTKKMKTEKPAKQRSDVRKNRSKRIFFRMIFGLVKIIGYLFLIIDRYWPKIVDSCRELL